MGILKKIALFMLAFFILLIGGIYFFSPLQRFIDRFFLEEMSKQVMKSQIQTNSQKLQGLIKGFSLGQQTDPVFTHAVQSRKLEKWNFDSSLQSEILYFPSLIMHGNKRDEAVFYFYSAQKPGNRKILLWIPGMGVSDGAYFFIKTFFKRAVEAGYDLAVYIPPFHLSRQEKGKEAGEGMFTRNLEQSLFHYVNAVKEIRTAVQYFKKKGYSSISGWGGSMGAAMLLLASIYEEFHHLALMIPVLNWKESLMDNKSWAQVFKSLEEGGIEKQVMENIFLLMSPVNYQLKINPERTLILYGKEDQLVLEKTVLWFAEKYGIKNVKGYAKSHSTVLLDYFMYKDYGDFINNLK